MRADTLGVLLKGVGLIGAAIAGQLAGSLAQWANSNTWPDKINWTVIWILALLQGFNSMVTFASGSWAAWRNSRMNGNPVAPPETKP